MATGFIGIGIMGEGMAGCLLKAGKKLVVWNRDASKAQKLATAYPSLVTVAATPNDVVDQCGIQIMTVAQTIQQTGKQVHRLHLAQWRAHFALGPGGPDGIIDKSAVAHGLFHPCLDFMCSKEWRSAKAQTMIDRDIQ